MTLWNILLIFVLIGLNAFFVTVEFASVASRRARLDVIAKADDRSTKIVHSWLENSASRERLIAASQLGVTVVSLALGAVGENTFEAWLHPFFTNLALPRWLTFLQTILPALPLIISLTVITSLHVVLGEQVPKVAVLRSPERFALFAAPGMQVFTSVFRWFVDLLDWTTRVVLGLFGLSASGSHSSVYSLDEIKELVSGPETRGVIEEPERNMLSAVIDFGELVVRQVSLPRTEITAVAVTDSVSKAINLMTEYSITKLPAYEENLDHILGILHLHDLVRALQAGEGESPLRAYLREALFVPETISVNDLLLHFRASHTHIAIVLDEFGGTYGLVTLEDLLEEIIGEVQDTFDATPPSIQPQADGTYLIDGMTLIEEINQHFGLELEDANYDTLAGFILGQLGRIAMVGDEVDDAEHHVRLRVEKMDRLRIASVSMQREE